MTTGERLHHLSGPLHRGHIGRSGSGTHVVRPLGIVGLSLVIISAMDSIRNLPTTATFGWVCVFFGHGDRRILRRNTHKPARTYPVAVLVSATVVVASSIFGSLASHLTVKATGAYVAVMVFGVLAVCITPFILHRKAPAAPLSPDGADQPTARPSPAG